MRLVKTYQNFDLARTSFVAHNFMRYALGVSLVAVGRARPTTWYWWNCHDKHNRSHQNHNNSRRDNTHPTSSARHNTPTTRSIQPSHSRQWSTKKNFVNPNKDANSQLLTHETPLPDPKITNSDLLQSDTQNHETLELKKLYRKIFITAQHPSARSITSYEAKTQPLLQVQNINHKHVHSHLGTLRPKNLRPNITHKPKP